MTAFLQAKHYHSGRVKPVRLVCIHAMQSAERLTTAEDTARMFATTDREASAHECIDADSVVGCVRDEDTAWAAPGANADGVHLELAGMSEQTAPQWEDAYSRRVLALAAKRAAVRCRRYGIPVRWLTVEQLRDGRSKGLTTHADVTAAWPGKGDHWDPGHGFPRDLFLTMVQAEVDALAGRTWTRSRLARAAAALGVAAAVVGGVSTTTDPTPAPPSVVTSSPTRATSPAPSLRPSPTPAKPRAAKPAAKPVAAPPAVLRRVLRPGATGGDVRAVQRRVGARVTGRYDAATAARVRVVQRRHRLTPDGVVGARTAAALGFRWVVP